MEGKTGDGAPPPSALERLFLNYLNPLQEYLIFSLPPGPQCIQVSSVVDVFKAATMPVFFGLMAKSGNYSHGAYLITALHGCYGLVWFLKGLVTPDTCVSCRCCRPVMQMRGLCAVRCVCGRADAKRVTLTWLPVRRRSG